MDILGKMAKIRTKTAKSPFWGQKTGDLGEGEQTNCWGSGVNSTPISPIGEMYYGVPKATFSYKMVMIM